MREADIAKGLSVKRTKYAPTTWFRDQQEAKMMDLVRLQEEKDAEADFDVDNPYRRGVPLYANSYDFEAREEYVPKGDSSPEEDLDTLDMHAANKRRHAKMKQRPEVVSHYSTAAEHLQRQEQAKALMLERQAKTGLRNPWVKQCARETSTESSKDDSVSSDPQRAEREDLRKLYVAWGKKHSLDADAVTEADIFNKTYEEQEGAVAE